jgi:hypothetical protein
MCLPLGFWDRVDRRLGIQKKWREYSIVKELKTFDETDRLLEMAWAA